jgi:hypothetical protein
VGEEIRVQTSVTIVTAAMIPQAVLTGKNKNPTSEASAASAIFSVRLSQEQLVGFVILGNEVEEEVESTGCMIGSLV